MTSANPTTSRSSSPVVPCLHLRSKGMYVYNDGPGREPLDDDDNTAYWCFKTLKTSARTTRWSAGR